jgi:hypothetical protein
MLFALNDVCNSEALVALASNLFKDLKATVNFIEDKESQWK